MTISNKNIALSVVSGFMLVGLVGNVFISNVIHPDVKKLDLSAFVNLSNNISYISENKSQIEAKERLKIEEFAIMGIERKILEEISKNKITISKKISKQTFTANTDLKSNVNEEFQLTDEVKIAFSGLQKRNKQIELETIEAAVTDSIPSLTNELQEPIFKSEKIAKIDLGILENLKENYEEKTESSLPTSALVEVDKTSKEEVDDLVVYDYHQTTEKNFDKKLYDRPISESVRNVIKREIGSNPIKFEPVKKEHEEEKEIKIVDSAIAKDDYSDEKKEVESSETEEQLVFEYSKPSETKKSNFLASNLSTTVPSRQVDVALKAVEINNTTKKITNANGFEFEPDYDRNERLYDNNSGLIKISSNTTEASNEISGVVFKQGFVPTRVDIANENMEILIPLFSDDNFEQRYTIDSNNRNTVLISKTEGLEDVEIDSEYSRKILLDNKFNIVDSNPAFIMFTSVKTGNILIKYNHLGKTAQKIIFVGEGEMYFQAPTFIDGERESFELTTKNLLGNNEKALDISNRDVKVFNTRTYSKKMALNVHEIMMPKQVLGNRKYLEVSTQGNDVFVGVEKSGKIQIPNKDYVAKILETFNTQSLNDRCLVQFNFKQAITNFKVGGKNATGEMYTETLILDQDGNLATDEYSTIEKIFILGEMEGQLSIQAETENGMTINAKTFCSNGTYLIEEL